MIKSIQTVFKDIKFRSRLEARWAVFFESSGIGWEYEPEGYELESGIKYLPDFYLPKADRYIEIKPKVCTINPPKKIYLAGKISKEITDDGPILTQWRDKLLFPQCDSDAWSSDSKECCDIDTILGDEYTGPYYHDFTGGHNWPSSGKHCLDHLNVCNNDCISQIDECDAVFAWLDCSDCHGTIAEIGYAIGKGKQVYIGVDTEEVADELWFAVNMVDIKHRTLNLSVVDSFTKLMNPIQWDYTSSRYKDCHSSLNKCGELAEELQANASVLLGTPSQYDGYIGIHFDKSRTMCIYRSDNKNIRKLGIYDMNKAKSAYSIASRSRFEHGESPK